MELPELLTAKLRDDSLSLRDAETQCGISFTTLARIKRGGSCSAKVERRIRAWLAGEAPAAPMPGLRDQFAIALLSGFMVANAGTDYEPDALARAIYQFADAMLAARTIEAGTDAPSTGVGGEGVL